MLRREESVQTIQEDKEVKIYVYVISRHPNSFNSDFAGVDVRARHNCGARNMHIVLIYICTLEEQIYKTPWYVCLQRSVYFLR